MDYIKIRFTRDFNRLDPKFEDMFRSINPMFSLSEQTWKPQMDIYETPEEIYILSEIAGVKKEDLGVEINSKAVRVFGTRAEMPRMENATYRLAEIQYGKFERILYLPSPIDPDKVTASYVDGMLKVRLVKVPRDVVHRIPISDG